MNRKDRHREAAETRKSAGAQTDRGYETHRANLRRLFPGLKEREIGLSWMRAQGAGADVPHSEPEAAPSMPGHVLIHLLYGEGGSLSAALPVDKIADAINAWNAITAKLDPETRRRDVQSFIFRAMATKQHVIQEQANGIMTLALGLAFTSPAGPALREQAQEEGCWCATG
jgi:hypothetical protein